MGSFVRLSAFLAAASTPLSLVFIGSASEENQPFEARVAQRRDINAAVAGNVIECGASLLAAAKILLNAPAMTTRRPDFRAR